MIKPKLLVSFSGGRTSGFMLYLIWTYWRARYDITVVFANTGKEVEGTLLFVKQCAEAWGIHIVWLEYWPNPEKAGGAPLASVEHLVVNYETASRNGEPYERLIAVKGIPSSAAPFCSPYLKEYTIRAYMRAMGIEKYFTAIGIRADEDRVSAKRERNRVIYPLRDGGGLWDTFGDHDKQDVFDFWDAQDFDLAINADDGNCDNCWKKNFNLLIRNALRTPKSYDWWRRMEMDYGDYNPRGTAKPPFRFYRMGIDVNTIFFLADHAPREVLDAMAAQRDKDGCGESCEAFGENAFDVQFDDLD